MHGMRTFYEKISFVLVALQVLGTNILQYKLPNASMASLYKQQAIH